MVDDLDALPTSELAVIASHHAAIAARATEILAARAGGAYAADRVPIQLELIPGTDTIDPRTSDPNELLPDGSKRYLTPKEASPIARCGEDKLRAMVRGGAGFVIGNRYFVDRTRLAQMR
jgi:hypothetical protein